MDNKQLLIDAARAAGYDVYDDHKGDLVLLNGEFGVKTRFNPIESDADAFRLMVDCSLWVEQKKGGAEAYQRNVPSHSFAYYESYTDHNNKHAATRLAIVRAAAQSQERGL